jgi:hypothetical protein
MVRVGQRKSALLSDMQRKRVSMPTGHAPTAPTQKKSKSKVYKKKGGKKVVKKTGGVKRKLMF